MEATAPRLRPTVYPWPIFGWEYHEALQAHGKTWDTLLNRLGLEGWELVAVLHDESSEAKKYEARLLFKRPRTDLPNEEELRGLGFKDPAVFDVWLAEAREAYQALIAGARAEAEGRVQRGRPDDDDGDGEDDAEDDEEE
jgi:hypothetical protein